MPLKLVPPRKGKTPYWAVRGTYLGKHVDRSTKTGKRSVALQLLKQWETEIERGQFSTEGRLTFAGAALAYMQAGGDRQYMTPLLEHFLETSVDEIDQFAIDRAAAQLYPTQSAATRNRQVYTPVSAVLKHSGIEGKLKRPKGWRGVQRVDWLEPEQAFRVFKAADAKIDAEFGLFLRTLCYTGLRLNEAMSMRIDKLNLQDGYAQVLNAKNGDVMGVYLPPTLVVALANHPRGLDRTGKLFRFVKCGRLYTWLRTIEKEAGVPNLTFHLLRHTWATWMRRYAGMDIAGLVATQRWKDPGSARRYQHVVVAEESRKAILLPVENLRTPRRRRSKLLKQKAS